MPSDNPLLSVILPAYNTEHYIKQAIDSILGQTFINFELIVADDGSTDNTKDIINSYQDKRIIVSHNLKNEGKVNTVNRLYQRCKGKYVTIHDADDFSHRNRFLKQIALLEEEVSLSMCGCSFYNTDESGRILNSVAMPNDFNLIQKGIKEVSQFHGPTMIFKSDIVKNIGGVYRFFRNKEDIDLSVRIVEKYRATNHEEPLYYYRNHPLSLSKSGYNFLKFEGMKLINFLAEERRLKGKDSLMLGDEKVVSEFIEKLKEPYILDKGLFFRRSAAHNMYFKFYKNAIIQSFYAIKADPFRSENYKDFMYCIKKWLIHYIN